VPIQLREEQQFVLDASQLAALAEPPDLWFLGHPNNPTGQLLPPKTLTALLQSSRPVVLDEAFIDFLPDADTHSLIRQAAAQDGLYVIRSLTKFYAIPGIRLGYIVARPEAIAALRELQVPWSVNSLAQQIGCAVLDDIAYAEKTREWLAEELPWLTRRLRELGLTVYPGVANYVLIRLPDQGGLSAAALQQAMGLQGVLIRDASHFAGLDHHFVRLAVKGRADNEAMLAILAYCLQEEAPRG
jgi:threonine-phosphate decarboxylase